MKNNQTTSDKKCVNCGELAGACMSASLKRNICPSWRPKPQVICPFCGERYAEEGKELCKICSAPQETNEEIREDFEKELSAFYFPDKEKIETTSEEIRELNRRNKNQQALLSECFDKKEKLKKEVADLKYWNSKDMLKMALDVANANNDQYIIQLSEKNKRIKELEQQIEALNDRCPNCKNLGTEKCIKCFFSQEYFWENNWKRSKP